VNVLRGAAREALIISALAILLSFLFTYSTGRGLFARASEQSAPTGPAGAVPPAMIELDEARSLFESGAGLFVDARHEYDYRAGHIEGAVNIPLKDFDAHRERLHSLPRNRVLITYCDGADCNSSIELAAKLHQAGFSGVRIFFGGWQEWSSANLPTQKVASP
jgi:rhodanese-related sulfurtransferase